MSKKYSKIPNKNWKRTHTSKQRKGERRANIISKLYKGWEALTGFDEFRTSFSNSIDLGEDPSSVSSGTGEGGLPGT